MIDRLFEQFPSPAFPPMVALLSSAPNAHQPWKPQTEEKSIVAGVIKDLPTEEEDTCTMA
jgi:hypothetical protein